MDACCSYKIDKTNKVLFQKYKGDITLSDIMELMKKITSDKEFSVYFDHLVDFRDCKLNITPEEIPYYVKFIEEDVKIIGERTDIYLTDTPNQVWINSIGSFFSGCLIVSWFAGNFHINCTKFNVKQ